MLYEGPARLVLISFKLGGERQSARAMAASMVPASAPLRGSAVCFVPATARSVRERGFNPAHVLARATAQALGLPLLPLLSKTRETADQAGLSRDERRRNLDGAFASKRAPAEIVLVDDVLTTGATADACASALHAAGGRLVDVLTFAVVR